MDDRPATPEFELLETMRWTPQDGFFLLDRHLRRMQRSATYFDYSWNTSAVRHALELALAGRTEAQRVRLRVDRDGTPRIECAPLGPPLAPAKLGIATIPIDPTNVFLSNKTTNRAIYAEAAQPGYDDVILWTPAGDITETTLGNIVAEIDGRKVTPPLECGLLAGTFREELIERGEIVEARITLGALKSASRVWIINSVREWWPAYIASAAPTTPMTTSSAAPTSAKRSQR